MTKLPKSKAKVRKAKEARSNITQVEEAKRPCFVWNYAQDNGPHGTWSQLNFEHFRKILIKLKGYESMNIAQLKGCGCHVCEISSLSSEIKRALEKLGYGDEIDNLWSFDAGVKETRVWAIWSTADTKILWHDPHHLGSPSKRFNTK